jgi:hypothetical protein
MNCSRSCLNVILCALAMLTASSAQLADVVAAGFEQPHEKIVFLDPSVTFETILATAPVSDPNDQIGPEVLPPNPAATSNSVIAWQEELPADAIPLGDPNASVSGTPVDSDYSDGGYSDGGDGGYAYEPGIDNDWYGPYDPSQFTWQVGPSGIIYRSYLAGPHEPRISITPFFNSNHTFWDATVGGRGGVLRYGDRHPLHPQGWQLDVYGASLVRMDSENHQDLVASDFVFGFPVTYGINNWQFKLGYAHISSHLGDEYAIRYPGTLAERINYVRDGIIFGTSWFPVAACRLYGEFDWAFHNSGGSAPIHFQFGNELSRPGPTGLHGSPFLALNGRMREENSYGGDLTAQSGWLWRGETGKVFRIGAHYYNGKSSQSQFYRVTEEQIGMGLWYDF